MSAVLIRWIVGAVLIAGVIGTIYVQHNTIARLETEKQAESDRADRFADALEAYRNQFASQVNSLNAERRAEIIRQENLLKTLNLIGNLHDAQNIPVPFDSLSIIRGMYGNAAESGTAENNIPANPGKPDKLPKKTGTALQARKPAGIRPGD